MNNKETLDNKPDGATHYDGFHYYKCNDEANLTSGIWGLYGNYGWNKTGELKLSDVIEFRSIVDIERIVELEEAVAKLNKECGEFQEGFFDYMGLCDHLQIEVSNLKKKISILITPDSSAKPEGGRIKTPKQGVNER